MRLEVAVNRKSRKNVVHLSTVFFVYSSIYQYILFHAVEQSSYY